MLSSFLIFQIAKINVNTGETLLWSTNHANEFCGEATFIPNPDKTMDEDDGCVISAVSSGDPGKPDYLVILDGKTFKEIARAEFNAKFAQTLHGTFFPEYDI